MTFEEIQNQWNSLERNPQGRVFETEKKRALLKSVTSPTQRWWFQACQNWLQMNIPLPDFVNKQCGLGQLILYLTEFEQTIALVHMYCAQALKSAEAISLSADSRDSDQVQEERWHQLITSAWMALFKQSSCPLDEKSIQTVSYKFRQTLATENKDFREIRAMQTVKAVFQTLWRKSGASSSIGDNPIGFCIDIATELSTGVNRKPLHSIRSRPALLVRAKKPIESVSDNKQVVGIVASLHWELLPEGNGSIYAAPICAFVEWDERFKQAATTAVEYLHQSGLWSNRYDIRWQMEIPDHLLPLVLTGSSLGGEFGLGVAKLLAHADSC